MPAKKTGSPLPDTYFALVKHAPLSHIRDDAQLAVAQAMIDQLLKQELDDGAQEYLDALTDLVELYEDNHVSIPDASEADVLRELMRANALSQARLAKKTGIAQSTLSAVLHGTKSLTEVQAITLARHFHISTKAFLKA